MELANQEGKQKSAAGQEPHFTGRNLAGQRFGKLVALSPTDKRTDNGSVVWHCQCDCGKMAEVSARRLVRGRVRSCGCLSDPLPKNYIGKRFGRLTVIEYAGRRREKAGQSYMTRNYWKCRCDCGRETVVFQGDLQRRGKRGGVQSCGCLQAERAREALKLADGSSVTLLENGRKHLRKNNTSGCAGVSRRSDGRWTAYITFQRQRYFLGNYRNIEDAIAARKKAELMHTDFINQYYAEHPDKKRQNEST